MQNRTYAVSFSELIIQNLTYNVPFSEDGLLTVSCRDKNAAARLLEVNSNSLSWNGCEPSFLGSSTLILMFSLCVLGSSLHSVPVRELKHPKGPKLARPPRVHTTQGFTQTTRQPPQGLAAQPPQGFAEMRCSATCDEMRSHEMRHRSSNATSCVGETRSATTYDEMRCDMMRHG
jgi:hypothetical protein